MANAGSHGAVAGSTGPAREHQRPVRMKPYVEYRYQYRDGRVFTAVRFSGDTERWHAQSSYAVKQVPAWAPERIRRWELKAPLRW